MNETKHHSSLLTDAAQEPADLSHATYKSAAAPAPSIKFAAVCFTLMSVLALSLGVSIYARAESPNPIQSSDAIPADINFMIGNVAITWTYHKHDDMPFTEHHSITSAQVVKAIANKGPVRIPTPDNGELLITTLDDVPGTYLSARRYHDWTLVGVLQVGDDPMRSDGVFKFCSLEDVDSRCVQNILVDPDGVVSMTLGESKTHRTADLVGIDEELLTKNLLPLLNP